MPLTWYVDRWWISMPILRSFDIALDTCVWPNRRQAVTLSIGWPLSRWVWICESWVILQRCILMWVFSYPSFRIRPNALLCCRFRPTLRPLMACHRLERMWPPLLRCRSCEVLLFDLTSVFYLCEDSSEVIFALSKCVGSKNTTTSWVN